MDFGFFYIFEEEIIPSRAFILQNYPELARTSQNLTVKKLYHFRDACLKT